MKSTQSTIIACLLAAAFTAQAATATTINLAAARDNTLIQQTNPNSQLSNGLGDLFSGRTNQDGQNPATISIRRSLIYFDIAAAIPSGSTIKSVALTLRDVQGLNGNRVTTLHRTLADWGEGTSYQSGGMGAAATQNDATWLYRFYNFANPAASPAWTTPGGDFDPIVSAAATILEGNPNGRLYTWSGPGLVTNLQSWLDNPAGNFGWLILGDESRGQTAKRLNGRILNNAGDVAPVLVITYVPEPGTILLVFMATCCALSMLRTFR